VIVWSAWLTHVPLKQSIDKNKTNNQRAKLENKKRSQKREREGDTAGERERGGGVPEREGGAARGRYGGTRDCDGGSKVIARRPERTIWSGSTTTVGDGSGLSSLSLPCFILLFLFGTLVLI
jgi:hypothetical protein